MHVSNGLYILVVDDDVRCGTSLGEFLEGEGHVISTATRGREAVTIAQRFRREDRRFELSILDFHVPDMSGLETFESLIGLLPEMRAIFISGDASESLEGVVRSAGGLALIRKPLDLQSLRRTIDDYWKGLQWG